MKIQINKKTGLISSIFIETPIKLVDIYNAPKFLSLDEYYKVQGDLYFKATKFSETNIKILDSLLPVVKKLGRSYRYIILYLSHLNGYKKFTRRAIINHLYSCDNYPKGSIYPDKYCKDYKYNFRYTEIDEKELIKDVFNTTLLQTIRTTTSMFSEIYLTIKSGLI